MSAQVVIIILLSSILLVPLALLWTVIAQSIWGAMSYYTGPEIIERVIARYALRGRKIDTKWDEEVNRLIDKNAEPITTLYTVEMEGVRIWNANFPYAYARNYDNTQFRKDVITTTRTAVRLRRYLLSKGIEVDA